MEPVQVSALPVRDERIKDLDPPAAARPVAGPAPRITARIAGVLNLMIVVCGVFAQGMVSDKLISFSDAAATASNILANRSLFQMSYTVFLIEMACNVAAIALFYVLLSPVSRNTALVAAFIGLAAVIFKTVSRLFYITPLFVLSGNDALSAFNTDQLRGLVMLLLRLSNGATSIASAFFGISLLLNGYLIFRSEFLPRTLGILSMLGAVGWLRFFYPPLRYPSFTIIIALALVMVTAQTFWLIVYGVDEQKWKERYRLSRHAL